MQAFTQYTETLFEKNVSAWSITDALWVCQVIQLETYS